MGAILVFTQADYIFGGLSVLGWCGLGFLFVFWFVFLVWGWGRLQVASFGGFLRVLACFAVFCGWFVFINLVLQVVGVGGGAVPLTETV